MSPAAEPTTVQYRVIVGKKDELVDGPDDAAVVITVPLADVVAEEFDPAVAYMQGRLKSTGSTGPTVRAAPLGCCGHGAQPAGEPRIASLSSA